MAVGTSDPLMIAKITADHAWSKVKTAEQKWAVVAKSRSPEEWKKAVDNIVDKIVRIQAACVVWWDFFSMRPASDPWNHLDD